MHFGAFWALLVGREKGGSKKEREPKATDVTQDLICHTHRLLPVKHPLPSKSTDLHQSPSAQCLNHLVHLTFTLPKINLVLSVYLSLRTS